MTEIVPIIVRKTDHKRVRTEPASGSPYSYTQNSNLEGWPILTQNVFQNLKKIIIKEILCNFLVRTLQYLKMKKNCP